MGACTSKQQEATRQAQQIESPKAAAVNGQRVSAQTAAPIQQPALDPKLHDELAVPESDKQPNGTAARISNDLSPAEKQNSLLEALNVQFYHDGQNARALIEATSSGRIQLNILSREATDEEKQRAALSIQTSERAQKHLKDLELVRDMGVEVRASSSPPFIGLLIVNVKEVRGLPKVSEVQVKCEGDKGISKHPDDEDESGTVFHFLRAKYIFVCVFSSTTAVIKAKCSGPLGDRIFTGDFALKNLVQGTQTLEVPLTHKGNAGGQGIATVVVDYRWLRHTRDTGNYTGPATIAMDPRKLRKVNRIAGVASAIEYVSNVNHWLLSHMNIWSVPRTRRSLVQQHIDEVDEEDVRSTAGSTYSTGSSFRDRNPFPLTPRERWRWAVEAIRNPVPLGTDMGLPKTRMFDSLMSEVLDSCAEDTPQSRQTKRCMQGLLSMLNQRIDDLESQYSHAMVRIEELEYRLRDKEIGKEQSSNEVVMEPFISGRFEYGVGRPARKRKVLLFVRPSVRSAAEYQTPVSTTFLGKYRTDSKGYLHVPVPPALYNKPAHYQVMALLPEDNTYGKGSLFILAPGTKCVVFDMDGTLTIGDKEVVTQFALNALAASSSAMEVLPRTYDLKQRFSARTVARLWAAKGYQPIYVSGRSGSFYNLTLEWLIRHHYPPGPIHLTKSHLPTLPMYFSVGNFKVDYMSRLRDLGLDVYAAYGNTGTDVKAYEVSGVAKNRTFIIGPLGGSRKTMKIDNFTDHLEHIMKLPDSSVPIPYIELLWADMPTYRMPSGKTRPMVPPGPSPALAEDLEEQAQEPTEQQNVEQEEEDFEDDTMQEGLGSKIQQAIS